MSSNLFSGSLDTIIVKLLQDNGEMYGYEISKTISRLTNGKFLNKEGSLYPALHRLESKGLFDTESRSIGNRHRKYYKLSDKGSKEVKHILQDMQEFIENIQCILNIQWS